MINSGKILAVDPGEKNIGVAISDETGSLARPLKLIRHTSKMLDAATIAQIATECSVIRIIIGLPLGGTGEEIPQSRHAKNLAEAVQTQTEIPVELWDEFGSTISAKNTLIQLGIPKNKRGGHQDALAAAMILQSYLDLKGERNGQAQK